MEGYVYSVIGDRPRQEDAAAVFELTAGGHQGLLAMVCDGIGGLSNGSLASKFCTEHAREVFCRQLEQHRSVEAALEAMAKQLDKMLMERISADEALSARCGTTMVAVFAEEEKAYWLSVGDSRIYLFREEDMVQLTTDHNYGLFLQKKVQRGEMSPEDAANDPMREALISYIGTGEPDQIDTGCIDFCPQNEDALLLCSDGVYRMLLDAEMLELLERYRDDPEELVLRMVKTAAASPRTRRHDNTTAVLLIEESHTVRMD